MRMACLPVYATLTLIFHRVRLVQTLSKPTNTKQVTAVNRGVTNELQRVVIKTMYTDQSSLFKHAS
jgi:hypothetical protein